jgi:hypothetical protein
MVRDEDAVGGKVKAPIPLMIGRIAEENAQGGARGKFVGSGGGEVRVASAPKRAPW